MSRYIDADALDNLYTATHGELIFAIEEAPTADVVECKRGKWIIREPIHMHSICSCCDFYNAINPYYKYCPNCGADMRGEEDELKVMGL